MTDATLVFDVTDAQFPKDVIERSRNVPVVVDFWAAWCGPCRTLGPMLETAVLAREGAIVLAKVDVDAQPRTAQQFRVQGIPQVYGFRDGQPVDQFTGVIPQPDLDRFLDRLVPTPADKLVAKIDAMDTDRAIEALEDALTAEPDHVDARLALADRLASSDPDRAQEIATPLRPDSRAEAILARVDLARTSHDDVDELRAAASAGDTRSLLNLGRALAAQGDYDEAINRLLEAVERGDELKDASRDQLVALFGVLGVDDPRVTTAQRRLARALF